MTDLPGSRTHVIFIVIRLEGNSFYHFRRVVSDAAHKMGILTRNNACAETAAAVQSVLTCRVSLIWRMRPRYNERLYGSYNSNLSQQADGIAVLRRISSQEVFETGLWMSPRDSHYFPQTNGFKVRG
jgi:hypothetical protein